MGAGSNDNDGSDKPIVGGGFPPQTSSGERFVEALIEAEAAGPTIMGEEAAIAEAQAEAAQLDLKDTDERLPWLESEDDDDGAAGGGPGKAAGVVLGAVGALALLVGGIWWISNSGEQEQVEAGGVIEAPEAPYKAKPEDPGGKTFAGTGDSSFKVSEGQTAPARLGQAGATPKPATPAPEPSATASAASVSGVGVQIAAYSNEAQAKAGWETLSSRYEALKGVPHRIQEGRADIGTVYRLQAVAPDLAGAQALCSRLKGVGLACQVKN